MKKPTLVILSLFFTVTAFSQLRLTYSDHAPQTGDTVVFRGIRSMDPGGPGPEMVWDFSKMQDSGKNFVARFYAPADVPLKNAGACNLAVSEDEFTYYGQISGDAYEIRGVTSDRISLVYSDPLLVMKYPLAYGDHYSDNFVSESVRDEVMAISSDGSFEVIADAMGTLILPDRVIRNVLRVQTQKNYLEVGPCGLADRQIVRYHWFAAGYRYPVLTMTHKVFRYNGQERPVILREAYCCTAQKPSQKTTAAKGLETAAPEPQHFEAVIWPNPFCEELNCRYSIAKAMLVSAAIYDMSGNRLLEPLKKQKLDPGLYAADLNVATAGLAAGIYYIRFTFDRKTAAYKIVKL